MKEIVIFGCGIRGKRAYDYLKKNELPIKAFCDNNKTLWNTEMEGIPVISPSELLVHKDKVYTVVANANYSKDISEQLNGMGINDVIFDCELAFLKKLYKTTDKSQIKTDEVYEIPEILVVIDDRKGSKDQLKKCYTSVINAENSHSIKVQFLSEIISQPQERFVLWVDGESKLAPDSLDALYQTACDRQDALVCSLIISDDLKVRNAGYIFDNERLISRHFGEFGAIPEVQYVKKVDATVLNGVMFTAAIWNNFYRQVILDRPNFGEPEFLEWLSHSDLELYYQPHAMLISEKAYKQTIVLEHGWTGTSFSKECILVVDETIARYDTNAGHRSTKEYMEILLELCPNMIYITKSCAFDEKYTTFFQQKGVMVVYGEEWKTKLREKLEPYMEHINYAFVNRPDIAADFVPLLKSLKKDIFISYFGHDIHFLRLQREAEVTNNTERLEEARAMEALETKVLSEVDVAGYPSKVEVQLLQKKVPVANVVYYPLNFFETRTIQQRKKGTKGIMFVANYHHRPNVDAVLWFVKEVLPIIREKGVSEPLILVGKKVSQEINDLEADDIVLTGYLTDEELQSLYEKCSVCIVPLRYGAGMKGKVLEALYEGIPVVSTSIGVEGLDEIGSIVKVTDDVKEFAENVVAICRDKITQDKMSEGEQKYVVEQFGKHQIKEMLNQQLKEAREKNNCGS